ncbi:MAG: tRNA uridine-5-carboxymethylaminomethyl(34) synthesis GTPase MnmE, partial [Pseudomonadota bacterium]
MNLPTVFAVSTAPGRAGLAVIRVTGGRAATVLEELTGKPLPSPRMASRRMLYDREGELIDDALVIYFAGPASFTGEDVVELHCHGGRAVTAALLSAIAGLNGVDPAEPGEFTRRAFLNGKLDLAEIEALGDLLAAETEAQRLQAVQAASGTVRDRIALCREKLLQALAL